MRRNFRHAQALAFGTFAFAAYLTFPSIHLSAQQTSTCGKYMLQYLDIASTDTGEIVDVTSYTAPGIIADLTACVNEELKGIKRTEYEAAIGDLTALANADRAMRAERQLIELNVASNFVDTSLARRAIAIAWTVQRRFPADGFDKAVARNGAKSLLSKFNSPARQEADKTAMALYLQKCRALMPVPEKLGVNGKQGQWEGPIRIFDNKTDSEKSLIFGDTADHNNLWFYSVVGPSKNQSDEKQGVCVVFERFFGDNATDKFGQNPIGTICTDMEQKNACFFDNIRNAKDGSEPLLTQEQLKETNYVDLVPPNRIKNTCTACHIGQNPFISKPESDLGKELKKKLGKSIVGTKYEIVDFENLPDWYDNPPVFVGKDENERKCSECHSLPRPRRPHATIPGDEEVLPNYCIILARSANTSMPRSGEKAGWKQNNQYEYNPDYFHAIKALEKLCVK
jgi:hypothetical protein